VGQSFAFFVSALILKRTYQAVMYYMSFYCALSLTLLHVVF